jgi:serine protease AprX
MKPIVRRNLRYVLAVVLSVSVAGQAQAQTSGGSRGAHRHKLDNHLRAVLDAGARESQRVIIRTRAGERFGIRRALAAHGDRIIADHESIDALTAEVHPEDLDTLAGRDGVVSVSTDAVVRAKLLGGLLGGLVNVVGGLVQVVGSILLPNGADTEGAAVAPRVLRETLGLSGSLSGRGIGVAVIDSGLEMSYEFDGRVTAFYDFTRGGIRTSTYDDYGHGTHIASTIAGSGALSSDRQYRGLAPKVNLTILKVLDKNGAGWTSNVISAIDFAVANRAALKIDMINLSLGHPIYEPAASDPLVQAVERAVRAGVIVVAAAGNFGKNPTTGVPGYAGITSPGNAPSAITVGALRTEDTVKRADDWIPDYSSRGPTWYDGAVKPDIVAPGHNIVAAAAKRGTFYQTYPQLKAPDSDYIRMSGTSMATAVTTGVIALMLEANRSANDYPAHPSLTANAVKAMLQYSAFGVRKNGIEYEPLVAGAGAVNGKGAIELARAADTSAAPGTPWLTAIPAPWTSIGGEYLAWKQVVVWGTQVGWGNAVALNQQAWGSVVVWGTTDVTLADVVVWGTDLVWTDPQSWANVVVWGTDVLGVIMGDVVVWGVTGGLTPETTAWAELEGVANSTGMVSANSVR